MINFDKNFSFDDLDSQLESLQYIYGEDSFFNLGFIGKNQSKVYEIIISNTTLLKSEKIEGKFIVSYTKDEFELKFQGNGVSKFILLQIGEKIENFNNSQSKNLYEIFSETQKVLENIASKSENEKKEFFKNFQAQKLIEEKISEKKLETEKDYFLNIEKIAKHTEGINFTKGMLKYFNFTVHFDSFIKVDESFKWKTKLKIDGMVSVGSNSEFIVLLGRNTIQILKSGSDDWINVSQPLNDVKIDETTCSVFISQNYAVTKRSIVSGGQILTLDIFDRNKIYFLEDTEDMGDIKDPNNKPRLKTDCKLIILIHSLSIQFHNLEIF